MKIDSRDYKQKNLLEAYWVVQASTQKTGELASEKASGDAATDILYLALPGKGLTTTFPSSVLFSSVTAGNPDMAEYLVILDIQKSQK